MDETYTTPPEVSRYQTIGLAVGIIFAAVLVLGLFLPGGHGGEEHFLSGGVENFFRAYLTGFIFWVGVGLGCLGLLLLQYLTGGGWGVMIRRVLEAGTRTLPLLALLFIPVALGMNHIYEWIHPEHIADPVEQKIVAAKHGYLNVTFFLIRAALYFASWLALMFLLNRWSAEQDRTGDSRPRSRAGVLSGPGLILFIMAVTFASVDWVMSIEPGWFSTIFGLIFVIGWTLNAFTFAIAVMTRLANGGPLEGSVAPAHFHDYSKLLLAFVMVWAYFNFSQFLIIWSGNIPEETRWYLHRTRGGWGVVAITLVIAHFALPFFLLLSRGLKRNSRTLVNVALLVFLMRFVDIFWLIKPSFRPGDFTINFMDIAAPIAIGGLWVAFFAYQLKRRPLLPVGDPELAKALAQGASAHH